MGGWMMRGWGGPYQFGFGMIFNIIIFAFVVIVFIRYMRGNGLNGGCHHRIEKNAEDIVRERYARGEITKEQFQEMLKDLKS